MRVLLFLLLLIGLTQPVLATRGGENYPKVLTYSQGINQFPEGTQDSLSWYDVLICMDRPETIESLRERNPDQRYLWQILPQYVRPLEDENPWWLPDTLWSVRRLMIYYAAQNDWFLKDTSGEPIFDGSRYLLNWTEHCPVGTFGTSKGLRAAEWVGGVALPTIALSERYWDPWSWDSDSSYNGYMFEILADCLGSYGWSLYENADPDGDGIAEGVYSNCTTGGSEDPLSVLFREENDLFFDLISEAFPQEFVFVINENHSYIGPSWVTSLSGMKLENWLRQYNPEWHNWWDWFYGLTPPWEPFENWGAGYAWAEATFDKPVADHLRGWDLSFIEVWDESNLSEDENLRRMRYGLGTSMLGDGYFCYTADQDQPHWQPEFDWDFGEPLEEFHQELLGTDTLYVRLFSDGMVEVNPNWAVIGDVAPGDSRFTFWLPVDDLWAQAEDTQTISAGWTIPFGEVNPADSFELRYDTVPLTIENWENAEGYVGNPVSGLPGTEVIVNIQNLDPGTTFYLAVRTRTRGRLEPILSNLVGVTLPIEEDTTPPGTITDLRPTDIQHNWVDLRWTATGDDGNQGRAAAYRMRTLLGESIENEADWDRALPAGGLPFPGLPGSTEEYRLGSLEEGLTYGIAIRAEDDAGNLSPLHLPFSVTTLSDPPSDDTPPAAIADLAGESAEEGEIVLTWTAPGDDLWEGQASSYLVKLRLGQPIENEFDWLHADDAPSPPPDPGEPLTEEQMAIGTLIPAVEYGVAVRALDEAGNLAPLSNSLVVETGSGDPGIDLIPPASIDDLAGSAAGEGAVALIWTAPGDDLWEGQATSYLVKILLGRAIETEVDWNDAQGAPVAPPDPAPAHTEERMTIDSLIPDAPYGIAIRALDDAGNLASLGNPLLVEAGAEVPEEDVTPPAAINDLAGVPAGEGALLLQWSAPGDDGDIGKADLYEVRLRIGQTIETEEAWEAATIPGSATIPEPDSAGAGQEALIQNLTPGTLYGLALRARDEAGNLGDLSVPLSLFTEEVPDTVPPGPIDDLHLVRADTTSFLLAWSAPFEAGDSEAASAYLLRTAPEGTPEAEVWDLGDEIDGLGLPSTPGVTDSFLVTGLIPDRVYGIALASVDQAGNLSGPSNILWAVTEALPPPPIPPGAILDLHLLATGVDSSHVGWTAPGADADSGRATAYEVRLRINGSIQSEADWDQAFLPDTSGIGLPGLPGSLEEWTLRSLIPETTYALAIRARDNEGLLGSISNPITWSTDAIVLEPPGPIQGLALADTGETWCDLTWQSPAEHEGRAEAVAFSLAYRSGTTPVDDEADWFASERIEEGLPAPGDPGSQHTYRLDGLSARSDYAITIRCRDQGERLGLFGPTLVIRTSVPPDTSEQPDPPDLPPAPIEDLTVEAAGPGWVELSWTAVGEDSLSGSASAYRLAYLFGDPMTTIEDWQRAHLLDEGLPMPSPAGLRDRYRLEGLLPGTTYGIAIRAIDAAAQLSPFVAGILFTVPLEPEGPAPVADLRVLVVGSGQVWLEWSHPQDAESPGGPNRYEVGLSTRPILDEPWDMIPKHPTPPSPGEAGEPVGLAWDLLEPAFHYEVAVRVYDSLNRPSPLSNIVAFETDPLDLAPPDPPSNLRVSTGDEPGYLLLEWDPSASPDLFGYHVYALQDDRAWLRVTDSPIPGDRTRHQIEASGLALTMSAIDGSGNESARSHEVMLAANRLEFHGPFPHPVERSCRFEIRLPLGVSDDMLRLRVISLSGHLVRTLYDAPVPPSGAVEIPWDRLDDRGRLSAPGFYLVLLEAGGERIERRIFLAP